MSPPAASPDGPWHRVEALVAPDQVELVSDLLWQAGAAGIEERAGPDGAVHLLAGLPDAAAARAGRELLAGVDVAATTSTIDDDGLDGWRSFARPVRAGRFWLVPSWLAPPEVHGHEQVLWLDPGRTFGSGSHPTTQLVAALVGELAAPGQRVLDVGCGSGVLAIAAALRGAQAIGVDIDPDAPAATQANARRNGVEDLVTASGATVAEVTGPFDLVVANLLAPTIAELGTDLARLTGPAGRLVVSGLLDHQWELAVDRLAPLEPVEVRSLDGWVAVVLGQDR